MNAWVKNREADDLNRHRAHYDVTVSPISRKVEAADSRQTMARLSYAIKTMAVDYVTTKRSGESTATLLV